MSEMSHGGERLLLPRLIPSRRLRDAVFHDCLLETMETIEKVMLA